MPLPQESMAMTWLAQVFSPEDMWTQGIRILFEFDTPGKFLHLILVLGTL